VLSLPDRPADQSVEGKASHIVARGPPGLAIGFPQLALAFAPLASDEADDEDVADGALLAEDEAAAPAVMA